jgi:hypothetical protein
MSERTPHEWNDDADEIRDPSDDTVDLGEARHVRTRNRSIKQREIVDKAATQAVVRNIMGTAIGRKWMADLLAYCEMDSYTMSAPDMTEMLHREGRRTVGVRLLTEVCDACPERYAEMRKELSNVRK